VLRGGGIIHNFFKRKEKQNYDAANIIGVQSPANLQYFSELGLDKKYNLEVLYNWTTLAGYHTPNGKYRNQFGLNNKVVFFYGGNIGVSQDMDNIIHLAKAMRNEPSAYFLLVGEGSEILRLQGVIAAQRLKNVSIHPAVDQQEYMAMLSEFDVGLISLDRNLKT